MKSYIKKLEASDIGFIEIVLWSFVMSVTVYAGIAGMDQFENAVYNLVEHILG